MYLELTILNYTLKELLNRFHLIYSYHSQKRKREKEGKNKAVGAQVPMSWLFAKSSSMEMDTLCSQGGVLFVLFPLFSHYFGQDGNSFTSQLLGH